MKKALKVIGWIVGIYLVYNTLCLAFIGGGRIVRKTKEKPSKSIIDNDVEVFWDAIDDWKSICS